MEELLKLIERFEEETGRECVSFSIFSDGSGSINEYDEEIFLFDTLDELRKWLEK